MVYTGLVPWLPISLSIATLLQVVTDLLCALADCSVHQERGIMHSNVTLHVDYMRC
jgi:hypothetical protein